MPLRLLRPRLARASVSGLACLLLAAPAAFGGIDRDYEQRFLELLMAWAQNPSEETFSEIATFEVAATGYRLRRVSQAQERVANDLRRIDAAALLPLAALHRQLYADHLDADHPLHARAAALRLRDVVDDYAKRLETPDAKAAAMRQWTSLGLLLLARGGSILPAAEICLTEALDHADSRRTSDELRRATAETLHSRAVVWERLGEPAKALDDLEELLEIDPGHTEARLRYALNLRHMEEVEEAAALLDELRRLEKPAWIAVLAAQELARLELEAGRRDQALELLEEAGRRFPNNARLMILRAHVERPRWRESSRLVSTVLSNWRQSSAGATRPRTRYEGPLDDDDAVHRAVARDVESHLPSLVSALEILTREANRVEG